MFSNIVWNKNENLDGYKLNKMINNDNINYQLAIKAPKGLLFSLDFESLSTASRTMPEVGTSKFITSFNVYHKNLPYLKNENDLYLKRYYKISLNDMTIDDAGTHDLSGNFTMDRGFFFVFTITPDETTTPNFGVNGAAITTRFGTTLKPGRYVAPFSGASAAPRYWRTQAGEFIVPMVAHNFKVEISMEKYPNSNSPVNGDYKIENGKIWIEDIGMESF